MSCSSGGNMDAISPRKCERPQYDGDISSQICSSIRIRTKEARNNRKPSHQWQQHTEYRACPTWSVPQTCWVMDIHSLAHPPLHNSGSERHGCNRGAVNSGDIWTTGAGRYKLARDTTLFTPRIHGEKQLHEVCRLPRLQSGTSCAHCRRRRRRPSRPSIRPRPESGRVALRTGGARKGKGSNVQAE